MQKLKTKRKVFGNLKERERAILNVLYENEQISTAQLCEKFDISIVTLRKDLDNLEANGLVVRTHGRVTSAYSKAIIERQKANADEKTRIAKAAAAMIEEGDRVMIVAGTTTALIPKFLLGKRNIHIVTNSTLLLTYSRVNPGLSVTLVGGEFMADAEALIGSIALKDLDLFYVKSSFIGADGFSEVGGITANHVELAGICRKVIANSQQKILLADSSKYGKKGFAYIDDLKNLSTLITDKQIADSDAMKLSNLGLDIIKV
ncbi:MAG: DeoR/GlpR family DNA-binding transcription regulator [Prevotellaceae bacterium]|nr:DeoR/GlpR family DNA-binding transcription regulator [Prevotellaceae bacterium]